MQEISLEEARYRILHAQGLLGVEAGGALPVVERLGYVQIDTISVVQRAHHHVLWSRAPLHQPADLASLLRDGHVFEYWSHAASYLPMRDFRFSLPRKRRYAGGKSHWFTPTAEHKVWRRRILRRIREEGPCSARDFLTEKGGPSGWFNWRPAKQSLEQLFMEGVLMVRERRGFNKYYDFTENVLPSAVDTRMPSPREFVQHLIVSFLRAHALGLAEHTSYLRRGQGEMFRKECRFLLREGVLREVRVEGFEKPFLTLGDGSPERVGLPQSAGMQRSVGMQQPGSIRGARLLSPFDNLLIQRKRTLDFFGFDYTLECYVPAAKRKFGYFGLPLLLDGQIVGQLDLKADRSSSTLLVQNEQLPRLSGDQTERVRSALADFAQFNACEKIARPKMPRSKARSRALFADLV